MVGWVALGLAALAWEFLGIFHVAGIWPLTWLVRDALDANETLTGLALFTTIAGGGAWLLWHFLVQKRRYAGKQ